jgi:hypothetical protein
MTSVVVRRARPQDAAQLAQLCVLHAAYEGGGHASELDLPGRLSQALFAAAPRAFAWIAEVGSISGAVGFATASPVFSTWHGEDFPHLDCLYLMETADEAQAGLLVDAVCKHAVTHGFRWLEWQTPSANAPAIRFYERLGAVALAKQRFTLSLSNVAHGSWAAVTHSNERLATACARSYRSMSCCCSKKRAMPSAICRRLSRTPEL